MGRLHMEVFRFTTYVMFPIGIMLYFGVNLDNRFAVEGFWPKPEECNKVPESREEALAERERIVARQKLKLARKLDEEKRRQAAAAESTQDEGNL